MTVRRLAALMVTVAVLSGCTGDAQSAAEDSARATADEITRHLRTDLAQVTGEPAVLRAAQEWLADPPQDFTANNGPPRWKVLATAPDHFDLVIYKWAKDTSFGGKEGGWGRICERYRAPADKPTATEIECPADVPQTPT